MRNSLYLFAFKGATDLANWLRRADSLDESSCIQWFEDGLVWLLRDYNQTTFNARLAQFFNEIEDDPSRGQKVVIQIERALLKIQWVDLFLETSFSRRRTFMSALWDNLLRPLLPDSLEQEDARLLFAHLISATRLEDLSQPQHSSVQKWIERWQKIKPLDSRVKLHFQKSAFDAVMLLSYRVANTLNDEDFRKFHLTADVQRSPFHQLPNAIAEILREQDSPELSQQGLKLIAQCETELHKVLEQLEQTGVSLDLVYLISLQEVSLRRLRNIVTLFAQKQKDKAASILSLIEDLITDQLGARSFSVFLEDQLDLLLRRVVERTGKTGEHYITRTKKEYWSMLKSSAGGGVLTSLTSLLKSSIGHWSLPLFFEGLFSWVNYSGSFISMQFCHFTLASKQPASTAPALAAKLKNLRRQNQLFDFVQEVAQLTRSQFIAAVGNVGAVIPTAILIDLVYTFINKHHIFDLEYSQKVFDSLNPTTSLTFLYATMTGVLLWGSSIISGAVENWTVYRRIPQSIARSPFLMDAFGVKRTQKLAAWFETNIAGLASNISIGFLLAFFPIFGKFFGLGLEVRHITLSAGSWAYAVCASFGRLVHDSDIWMAFFGILGIGVLNITVSFSLALFIAIRARRLRPSWLRALWNAVYTHLRLRPFDFLFPPQKN